MTQDLHRLIYYSRNMIEAEQDAFRTQVGEILSASQRNNGQADVTGALLFNAGCFGQVLEGPRRAIEATFERIQCDPRHGEVSLLAFEPAATRAFPNWSMAFVGGREDHADSYGGIAGESGYDPSRMTGDRLLETLHRLALEEDRAAAN